MNVNNTAWYVSAVLPYSTVKNLIDRNVGQFGMLVAAILLCWACASSAFTPCAKTSRI